MMNRKLFISTLGLAGISLILTGCSTNKSSASTVDSTSAKSSVVVKTKKATKANKVKEAVTADKAKEQTTTQVAATPNTAKVTPTTTPQTKPVVTVQAQAQNTPVATPTTLQYQGVVNVGMGLIAQATGQNLNGQGYWNFAKSTWGISDEQVLTSLGGQTYQIFSQGAERYQLSIQGTTAVITATSVINQTVKQIVLDLNSNSVVSSDF